MADIIQQRRDIAARWAQYNPILLEGEVGYVTDNPNQYKIGNGVSRWNDLPLRGYTGTIAQDTGNDENAVMSQKVVTEKLSELGSKVEEKTDVISERDVKLIKDKLWNSGSGTQISYSGYVCSEIVPYDINSVLKHDGYISEFLYWDGDVYLGVSKSYKEAFENANRVAFNFNPAPTYMKIIGSIKDLTDNIDNIPMGNSKRLCYSGGIEERIVKAENGFSLLGHYYDNGGNLLSHSSVRCTELLPINDESIVYVHNSTGGSNYSNVVYFDVNKQFLGTDSYSNIPITELCLTIKDFPNGAKYIAANGDNSNSYGAPFILISTAMSSVNYLDDTKYTLISGITWIDAGTPSKSYYSNFIKVTDGAILSTKNPRKKMFRVILYDAGKNIIANENISFSDGEAKGSGGASGRFQGNFYIVPSGYAVAYVKVQYVEVDGEPNIFIKIKETELVSTLHSLSSERVFSSKKIVTIGDSLTANCVWQPYLAKYRNLVWSEEETVNGVGFVSNIDGTYTTDDMSSDSNYRKAYPMAIGGTTVKPSNENSIYIRGLDAVHYKPDIILIYGGENDFINPLSGTNPWGSNSLSAKELVEQTEAYKGGVSSSVSTMAAFKGLIEQLSGLCPKAKIYLVAPMRCRCDIGKTATEGTYAGQIRFKDLADVINYDVKDRIKRRDYIKALGEYYGLPVIDLMNTCGVTHFNEKWWYGATSVDCTQVHPNIFGYEMMAKCMATYI